MIAVAASPEDVSVPAPGFASGDDRSFFGHPRGLAYLAFTEAWERFSFYGMTALLLLYMIQRLLTPEVMGGVLGLGVFRSALEGITGPLSDRAFASQVYGLYTGLVYFTPMFGGLLADRLLGQRNTVMLGAGLMAAGHILMAFDAGFLIALSLLILGSGCLKGNISTQVGHLYLPGDESRRTRAFAIFSAAINVGAFAGPLICAIVAQAWGWHAGFGLAGGFMLVALAIYVKGWPHLPPDVKRIGGGPKPAPMTVRDWQVVAMLGAISAIQVPVVIAYYQQTNVGLLFIEESVTRTLWEWTVPTPAFVALDGLFCFALVPLLIMGWRWQERRGREPGEQDKIEIGYLLTVLANLLMLLPAGWIDADPSVKVSMVWPFLLSLLNAIGFLYYWPTLLALFSRAAPRGINATMMGILFFSSFAGNVLKGTVGGYWGMMSRVDFYLLHAGFAAAALIAMLLIARPATRLLAPRTTAP
ncbi:peptide MFS transporter [Blastomonas fulva]|jgi:POT family proton-dependent oligopeptide transporter|uniref:peptide MFS transporter n=1 Tax=Blastomonas fulva TaxID=1550728 RepID=UPI003D2B2728